MPYEPTHSWQDLAQTAVSSANVAAGTVAGTYILFASGSIVLGAANSVIAATWLDPADFSASGKTLQIRIRGTVITNAVAPGQSFAFSLYPVATWAGASGVQASVATVGTAVVTATVTTPGASTQNHAESSAATFPAAGFYVPALVLAGTTAANAIESVGVRLQWRLV